MDDQAPQDAEVVVPTSCLERIQAALERLEDSETRSRRAYPLKEAAFLLGFKLSKLKGLLRDGSIRFIRIGGSRLVTDEELRRVTSPAQKMMTPATPPATRKKEKAPSGKDEAAKIRAALKGGG